MCSNSSCFASAQEIGKGVTNGSGEFHVEFEGPSGNLSVALGLREEGTVVSLGSSSARHS